MPQYNKPPIPGNWVPVIGGKPPVGIPRPPIDGNWVPLDPAEEQPEEQMEARQPEPSWEQTIKSNAWTIAPGLAGGALGLLGGPFAPVTVPLGSAIGSFIGSHQRQKYEMGEVDEYGTPLRQEYNPKLNYVEGALGLLPGITKFPGLKSGAKELAKYGGKMFAEGTAQGAVAAYPEHWAETGEWNPGLSNVAKSAVASGVMNVGLGGGLDAAVAGYKPSPVVQPRIPPASVPSLDNATQLGINFEDTPPVTPPATTPPATPPVEAQANENTPIASPADSLNAPVDPVIRSLAERPPVITIRRPDAGMLEMYRNYGYVPMPGMVSVGGFPQMVLASEAQRFVTQRTPQPAAVPQPNVARPDLPSAIRPNSVAAGNEVSVPNDRANSTFIANMKESGYELVNRTETTSLFQRLRSERGVLNVGGIWDDASGKRRYESGSPTPDPSLTPTPEPTPEPTPVSEPETGEGWETYRLPDGRIIPVRSDTSRSAPTIDFTMANGERVVATREHGVEGGFIPAGQLNDRLDDDGFIMPNGGRRTDNPEDRWNDWEAVYDNPLPPNTTPDNDPLWEAGIPTSVLDEHYANMNSESPNWNEINSDYANIINTLNDARSNIEAWNNVERIRNYLNQGATNVQNHFREIYDHARGVLANLDQANARSMRNLNEQTEFEPVGSTGLSDPESVTPQPLPMQSLRDSINLENQRRIQSYSTPAPAPRAPREPRQLSLKLRSQEYWDKLTPPVADDLDLDEVVAHTNEKRVLAGLSHEYALGQLAALPQDGPPKLTIIDNYGNFTFTYRAPNGEPVAHATMHPVYKDGNRTNRYEIGSFVADRSRGLLYGRAVLTLAKEFTKRGVIGPSGSYSRHTEGFMRRIREFLGNDAGYMDISAFGEGWDKAKELANKFIRDTRGEYTVGETFRRLKAMTGWGQGASNPPKVKKKKGDPAEINYVKEALSVPSAATTMLDMSAPGRQGLSMILTPEFWGAVYKSFKGLSYESYKMMDDALRNHPLHIRQIDLDTGKAGKSYGEEIGLKLYTPASEPGEHAESVASRWLEVGFGNDPASRLWKNTAGMPIRATNRAFITFLNHLRTNRAQKLLDQVRNMSIEGIETGSAPMQGMLGSLGLKRKYSLGEAMDMNPYHNLKLGKEIADFVNTATGQAPLKTHLLPFKQTELNLEKHANLLNMALFSPKLLFSRLRMLNPSTYIMASPFVRKQYMKAMLSTAAAWYMFTELAKLADPTAEVNNENLTSADFGKIKIGNTRMDPGGGFLQFLVAYGRAWQGGWTSSSKGEFHRYGEGYQAQSQQDMVQRFMVNKLNPTAKFAYDIANATQYNPFHFGDRTMQMFIPLVAQDLNELYHEDPSLLPWMIPIAGGMGTQTYEKGESVAKFIDKENDWIIQGGSGLRSLMPWNWDEEQDPFAGQGGDDEIVFR